MNRNYEAVIALNTKGTEDSVEKLISAVSKEIEAEGGKLKQIDQLGRRKFANPQKEASEAFYVNYHFEAAPTMIVKLQARLKLNAEVIYQYVSAAA
jgi:small subunit ribosomal protein S6